MIRFLDIKAINGRYRDELVAAATRVIDSGWYVAGQEVQSFEEEFAKFCGVKACVGVANGLDALRLVLEAWLLQRRLAPGDIAVVPSNTFVATALAVSQAGLRPVFVDPDEKTFNLSAEKVEQVLKETGARVVVPVHLYGQLADIEDICVVSRRAGALVLEDAAQAHGASKGVVRAGAFGDAAAFSFYPGKNPGALGDAGAVTTDDDGLALVVRKLRNYGSQRKYVHEYRGFNSRLDEIQAALLRVRLKHLPAETEKRRVIADRYISEIRNPAVLLPSLRDAFGHVWHLFVLRTLERDRFMSHMRREGVETAIHYPVAIQDQDAYRGSHGETTNLCRTLHAEVVSLPIDPTMSTDSVTKVVSAVNTFVA